MQAQGPGGAPPPAAGSGPPGGAPDWEARYRQLVASVTDYLFTVTVADGRAAGTTHGPGCVGVTGYTAAEFAADPLLWLEMVPAADRDAVLAHAARVLADVAEGPLEHRIVHKDGTVRWVRNTPVPLHDREGRLVAYDGLVQDVTAEKRAEIAVRESAEQFRALFESSPAACWLEDASALRGRIAELRAQGADDLDAFFAGHPGELAACLPLVRVLDVNRAALALHGAASKEELLAGFERTLTPEALGHFGELVAALCRGETARAFETTFRTLGGALLHCLVNWSVVHGHEESLARVVIAVTDISDRRRTEDLFRRIAAELLSRTGPEHFAALTAFVARELDCEFALVGRLVDGGARVRTLSVHADGAEAPAFTYELAGTPCEGVIGGGSGCFLPSGVQQRFPADAMLVPMGVQSYAGLPLFGSDGRVIGLLAALGRRARSPGDAERLLSLLRVLSARAAAEIERAEVEAALRDREEFVRHILDAVDEAFIVVDRDYRVVSCNRAYRAQIGGAADVCTGRLCWEASHDDPRPCWERGEECPVRLVFATGEPQVAVHAHRTAAGGSLRAEVKAFPLRAASGEITGAIEVINDITDRVRLEEQLRQAQKMEAVGLLAGGVAHDFNNILSAIIGFGSLIELKLPRDSACRPYAQQILAAGERAAGLTQSLLAFSRKQVINPRLLDLNEVILEVEKLLRRVLGEDVELRTVLAGGDLPVFADPGQVEQVLLNLATNARDAMPRGGVLALETARASLDEAFVRAHGFGRPGEFALLTVADTGSGMEEMVRARIFEPFFTTKELGRGTGLGLAMVYGAVRQNQGYVAVESQPGQGSRFRIWLPLARAAAPPPAETAPPPAPGGTERLLVVEDDPAVRSLLSTVLREHGYTVDEAVDGVDALERCAVAGGAFALCILDVVMPRLNGRETWERLRARVPGLKALFVSGFTADIMHKRGILEQGVDFLAKPIAPNALLAKVRQVLDSPSVGG
jgi:PAS domain S-box-containing protein